MSDPGRKAMPELRGDECHVWWAALTQCAGWHTRLLDATESARRRSYLRAADRDRFTVGVALTRLVLGAYLGVPPAGVPLDRTCGHCGRPHGRPRLAAAAALAAHTALAAHADTAVDFSVSHAGDVIGLAIARSHDGTGARRTVGLDVELMDAAAAREAPVDIVLSAAEHLAYRRLDAAARPTAFFRSWVRKEAVLKATGDGLRVSMTHLTMSAFDQPPRLTAWQGRPGYPALVSMHDLPARPGYLATLALVGRDARVVCHDAAGLISESARSDDFPRLRASE
jgi:4'-phosphopantetheinyl transferase